MSKRRTFAMSDVPYSGKTDNFPPPPCTYEPALRGDIHASVRELRELAIVVCSECDPQSFHDCRSGMDDDNRWRVRAGVVRQDMLLLQTPAHNAPDTLTEES